MRSFVKIKSSRNGEIILPFTDICKSCHSRDFFTSQICLLTLFAKIKFSRKFLILQYFCTFSVTVSSVTAKKNKKNFSHAEYFNVLHYSIFILLTCSIPVISMYFRNKFDFWNVHGIMNTSGLLQS